MGPASTGWGRQPSDRRPGTDHELNTTAKLVTVANYLVQNDCKDELLKLINLVCRRARREHIMIRRRPSPDITKQKHINGDEKKARAGAEAQHDGISASSASRPLLRMRQTRPCGRRMQERRQREEHSSAHARSRGRRGPPSHQRFRRRCSPTASAGALRR